MNQKNNNNSRIVKYNNLMENPACALPIWMLSDALNDFPTCPSKLTLVFLQAAGNETIRNQKSPVVSAYSQTTLFQVKQLRPSPSKRSRNNEAKRKNSFKPLGQGMEMVCNLTKRTIHHGFCQP